MKMNYWRPHWKCVFTSADPNQKDQHKDTFLWSHKSHSLHFQSSSSIISTAVQYSHSQFLKSRCLVEPLVPLLTLLKDYGTNNGANHDSQQSAQQQQEHLPASEGRASEIPRRIINIVCFGCEHDKWKTFLSAHNMSVTTYQRCYLSGTWGD